MPKGDSSENPFRIGKSSVLIILNKKLNWKTVPPSAIREGIFWGNVYIVNSEYYVFSRSNSKELEIELPESPNIPQYIIKFAKQGPIGFFSTVFDTNNTIQERIKRRQRNTVREEASLSLTKGLAAKRKAREVERKAREADRSKERADIAERERSAAVRASENSNIKQRISENQAKRAARKAYRSKERADIAERERGAAVRASENSNIKQRISENQAKRAARKAENSSRDALEANMAKRDADRRRRQQQNACSEKVRDLNGIIDQLDDDLENFSDVDDLIIEFDKIIKSVDKAAKINKRHK